MFQMQETVEVKENEFGIADIYNNLLKEWLYDLTFQEKMIWLWNAKVELIRIKQRRSPRSNITTR